MFDMSMWCAPACMPLFFLWRSHLRYLQRDPQQQWLTCARWPLRSLVSVLIWIWAPTWTDLHTGNQYAAATQPIIRNYSVKWLCANLLTLRMFALVTLSMCTCWGVCIYLSVYTCACACVFNLVEGGVSPAQRNMLGGQYNCPEVPLHYAYTHTHTHTHTHTRTYLYTSVHEYMYDFYAGDGWHREDYLACNIHTHIRTNTCTRKCAYTHASMHWLMLLFIIS